MAFDDWRERALWLDRELEKLAADESFRAGPHRPRIEALSVRTHLRYWGR
ncbi:MAG: hypothetical protein ACRD2W_14380 [Acidimicrobiales bacterium]